MTQYPDVPNFREEVANTSPEIQREVKEDMINTILADYDRLTKVYQFDPKNKSTWPTEDELIVVAWTVADYEVAYFDFEDGCFRQQRNDWEMKPPLFWSRSLPALVDHMRSLNN